MKRNGRKAFGDGLQLTVGKHPVTVMSDSSCHMRDDAFARMQTDDLTIIELQLAR